MTDDELAASWLHGRPVHTQRAYCGDVARFRAFVGKPLGGVTLTDLQGFADSLSGLSAKSQARVLGSVKSFFRFAVEQGYLPKNPTAGLRLPRGWTA